ncbi:MAG: hypothetical protein Kow0091_10320 [Geminocystis sp.]|uniref:Uncharacterized protein n=2 Tax=Cyanobacterium TaxID=102234 RepID=K9Z1U9_CYAAP|nr:hypothetical protein Cyan10605_0541 [Cyanobacterium aponinum PCC 10605]
MKKILVGLLFSALSIGVNSISRVLAIPPTIATIINMNTGDRGCYVELLDMEGNITVELADFSICEQSNLINKKVELLYEKTNILASECQGNIDCKLSDQVMLIIDVKIAN